MSINFGNDCKRKNKIKTIHFRCQIVAEVAVK